jgi:hypothetical protein
MQEYRKAGWGKYASARRRDVRGALRRARRRISEPRYRWLRIPLGGLLVLAGLLGFLPILGFWMIPLGLSLLAVDFPALRPILRRFREWLRRLLGRQSADSR